MYADFTTTDTIYEFLGPTRIAHDATRAASAVNGHSVLVTGAGGSIGRAICREILSLAPKTLVLLDHSEANLHRAAIVAVQRTGKTSSNPAIIPVLGSVTETDAIQRVLEDHGIDVVFHAAAYKHVNLVEANPLAGIRNNVIGTYNVVSASLAASVETLILVSTDKANAPASIMGASKRVSEIVLDVLAQKERKRHYGSVRFGNVFGSSGSVVEIFADQIRHGGPLTVTHPDASRYFITSDEASHMLLVAADIARRSRIYVLDAGKKIRIIDLAKHMIQVSGKSNSDSYPPGTKLAIEIIGLNPGEKLEERLFDPHNVTPSDHPAVLIVSETSPEQAQTSLQNLIESCAAGDLRGSINALIALVPSYTPSSQITQLVPELQDSSDRRLGIHK